MRCVRRAAGFFTVRFGAVTIWSENRLSKLGVERVVATKLPLASAKRTSTESPGDRPI